MRGLNLRPLFLNLCSVEELFTYEHAYMVRKEIETFSQKRTEITPVLPIAERNFPTYLKECLIFLWYFYLYTPQFFA